MPVIDDVICAPKSSITTDQATLLVTKKDNTGPSHDELSQIHAKILELLKSSSGRKNMHFYLNKHGKMFPLRKEIGGNTSSYLQFMDQP